MNCTVTRLISRCKIPSGCHLPSWAGVCVPAVQCRTARAMAHEGIAHGEDGGGTRLAGVRRIMVYRTDCRRFACSVMLELGSRAPIAIEWPAVVLVICNWPHFNGNAQRRPRGTSWGLSLFSSHKPRASKRKIKSAEGLPKNLCTDSVLFGRLPLERQNRFN